MEGTKLRRVMDRRRKQNWASALVESVTTLVILAAVMAVLVRAPARGKRQGHGPAGGVSPSQGQVTTRPPRFCLMDVEGSPFFGRYSDENCPSESLWGFSDVLSADGGTISSLRRQGRP